MANEDVIPRPDPDFDTFQDNLLSKCNTNAVLWGIPPTVLSDLVLLQTPWAAAWLIAKFKNNRTKTQVEAKDLARKNYEAELRPFIQTWIYRNKLMNDADIISCGLKPRDTSRTKVPVPTTVPTIQMNYITGNVLLIRFFRIDDETGALHRGKPKGINRIQIVYVIGTQPSSPEQCTKLEEGSCSPLRINIDPNLRGQKVWFYARWINTTNEHGPWTDLDSFVL